MSPRTASIALFPLVLSACYIEPYVDGGGGGGGPMNARPYIAAADGGCWWDPQSRDYVWSFEANADDPDGVYDVVDVYVDVYDSANIWQDGFDLVPDNQDPTYWYGDWFERSTYLYCDYPGYVIDFTAVDSFGDVDIVSVYPYRDL